jgi:endonuclease G, mitochondrial
MGRLNHCYYATYLCRELCLLFHGDIPMASRSIEDLKNMLQQVDALSPDNPLRETLESSIAKSGGLELDSHTGQLAQQEAVFAIKSLNVLRYGGEIDEDHQFALEAIVMPFHRPVVDIVDGSFSPTQLTNNWRHLNEADVKQRLEATFVSIGRLEIPDHPTLPYAGTGFVVGDGLLMTNRHVAELFARGLGNSGLHFISGQSANVDFLRENGPTQTASLDVARVLMIHPYWDMALVEVTGLPSSRRPSLLLSVSDPSGLEGREVVTVGYPGYDPRGDSKYQQIQNRIFRGTYYVKRMQPGQFRNRQEVKSYDRIVSAVTHDCSSLRRSLLAR